MALVSLRQFAKLVGVNVNAVSLAIKAGRLRQSVARDQFGSPKIADVELAKQEWAANTSADHRARAGGGLETHAQLLPVTGDVTPDSTEPRESVANATERLKTAQANLAELKLAKAAGELVSAVAVERKLVGVFVACKTALLALPSRLKQDRPELPIDVVEHLDRLIREACEALRWVPVGGTDEEVEDDATA